MFDLIIYSCIILIPSNIREGITKSIMNENNTRHWGRNESTPEKIRKLSNVLEFVKSSLLYDLTDKDRKHDVREYEVRLWKESEKELAMLQEYYNSLSWLEKLLDRIM